MQPAGRHDVVDLALQGGAVRADEASSRSKVLGRLQLGDAAFRHLTRAAAFGVLIILSGVIVSLVIGAWPALSQFGFGFLVSERWNPVTENFGALAPIYGTLVTSFIAMLIAVPIGRRSHCGHNSVRNIAIRSPTGTAISIAISAVTSVP